MPQLLIPFITDVIWSRIVSIRSMWTLGRHGAAVVSAVLHIKKVLGTNLLAGLGLSVWRLHVLPGSLHGDYLNVSFSGLQWF